MRKLALAGLFLAGFTGSSFGQSGGYVSPASSTGSGGACVGANCFLLQNFTGYFGDTREVLDATWAGGGSPTVTFPNSDGPVTGDSGKLCWAMPSNANNTGPTTPGTLIVVVTKTQASCTSSAIISTASGNGMFTWGHDDTAAFVAATQALYSQPKCGALILPAARMMLAQGVSFTGAIAADCNINVTGQGYSSVIEMLPGFNFSGSNPSNVGCNAQGCFWNSNASSAYLYFTLSGEYQSLNGISTITGTIFSVGSGAYAEGLNFVNWGTSSSNNPKGLSITGATAFTIGVATTNWFDGYIQCNATALFCTLYNNGGQNVQLRTPVWTEDFGGGYSNIWVNNQGGGTELHSYGTETQGQGSCDIGALAFLDGDKIGLNNSGSTFAWATNNLGSGSPCILRIRNSTLKAGGTGAIFSVIASTTLDAFDDGGNTYNLNGGSFLSNAGTFRYHHRETGTCVFAAATTCTVNFAFTYGNSTLPTFVFTPINPGAVTFTVTALSTTSATITASGANSLSVGWEAVLN